MQITPQTIRLLPPGPARLARSGMQWRTQARRSAEMLADLRRDLPPGHSVIRRQEGIVAKANRIAWHMLTDAMSQAAEIWEGRR